MVPVKVIITGLVAFIVMSGCTKKKTSSDEDFTSTPAVTTTTPAASQDIFDEFYKEDTPAAPTTPVASKPSAAPVSAEFVENGRFVVQVSTVRSQALADNVAAKLSAKGYPTYVADVSNPTPALSGTYYRVRIGGFTSIAAARSFGENSLSADGYDYWVDNRSNDNVGLQGGDMGGGDTYYTTNPEPAAAPAPQAAPVTKPAPVAAPATPVAKPAPMVNPAPVAAPAVKSAPVTTPVAKPAPVVKPAPVADPEPKPASTPDDATSEWGNDGW